MESLEKKSTWSPKSQPGYAVHSDDPNWYLYIANHFSLGGKTSILCSEIPWNYQSNNRCRLEILKHGFKIGEQANNMFGKRGVVC